jgi:acylpyruvate hydrolase
MSRFWETGKKIVAVGRNYAQHAKELGNAVPTKPFFFLKPTTSYLRSPHPIQVPPGIGEIHHEGMLIYIFSHKN